MTYTAKQKVALAEELRGGRTVYRRNLNGDITRQVSLGVEEQYRRHRNSCWFCTVDNTCPTGEMFEQEIESLTEALGYNDRDSDGVDYDTPEFHKLLEEAFHLSPKNNGLGRFLPTEWWLEVTTDPDRFPFETVWRNGKYELTDKTRWFVSDGSDEVTDLPRGNGKHKSITTPENNWLANLSILAVNDNGDELTKEQTRAALRVWFPKTTQRKDGSYGTADIAFHSTFLNFLTGGARIRAYCAPCKRELFFDNSMENILRTVEHALSHYPRSRVSFYTDGLGYRRFRLTGSSIDSEQVLSESFLEDVGYWEQKAQQAHQARQYELAHTFYERAQWYRKAASVDTPITQETTPADCSVTGCERYAHTGYHVAESGERSLDGTHWVSIQKVVKLSKLLPPGRERTLLAQSIKLLGWA